MKRVFLPLAGLIIHFTSLQAQDSCRVTIETDKFTDKKRVTTVIVGNNPLYDLMSTVIKSDSLLLLNHYVNTGNFCVGGPNSEITYLFDDKTKFTVKIDSEIDCRGNVFVSVINSALEEEMKLLENKVLTAIRIKGIDNVKDFDIDRDKAEQFKRAFKCVRNTKF